MTASLTAQEIWVTTPGVDFLQLISSSGGAVVGGINSNGVGYGGLAGTGGGGGSSSFSAITAGTNTAALVVGTGGSLSASGSGTITATAIPFSGVTGTATEGQLPATTVFTDTAATFGAFAYNFSSSTLTPPVGWFQTNTAGNTSQNGINLINGTSGAGQVTATNTGGNSVAFNVANFAGGGATLLAGTLTSALQNDLISVNGSGVLVNKTPGVAGRTVSGATDTINCAAGGDRGTVVTYTSASLVTVTIGQAGTTCLSNFYVRLFSTASGGIKIVSTVSTLNGIAAGTGITYPQNTWVDITSIDNATWTLEASRVVKGGTNITEVLNSDGSVTFNAASGGGAALSAITAATSSPTALANGNFAQTWNWAQTTNSQSAFTFGETSAATGGTLTNNLANQAELAVSTASASTATPLSVKQGSVTGTTGIPALQISTTWNNASLTGQGIVFSVIDTASSAGSSNLFTLFGGTSGTTNEFNITQGGNLSLNGQILISNGNSIQGASAGASYSIQGGLGANNPGASAGNLTLTGGLNAGTTASTAGGNLILNGGPATGASGANQGGTASLFSGAVTSATGIPGPLQIGQYYLKGTTVTVNNLQCLVAATSMTTADCAANPTNVVGVALTAALPIQVQTEGQVLVNSSNTAVVGDTVCAGGTAGKVTDNGNSGPCTSGVPFGTVVSITQNGASGSLPLVAIDKAAGQAPPVQTAILTSQYTNSTTGFTNVTGGNNLAFAVNASTNYVMQCTLYYQAASTGGLNIEFTGPASPTAVTYGLDDPGTATTLAAVAVATSYSTSLGAAVGTASTNFPATVTLGLINGTTAGTVQMLAKSSAAVQLQIQAGSFCTMQATLK
jgi:hypothetical protein